MERNGGPLHQGGTSSGWCSLRKGKMHLPTKPTQRRGHGGDPGSDGEHRVSLRVSEVTRGVHASGRDASPDKRLPGERYLPASAQTRRAKRIWRWRAYHATFAARPTSLRFRDTSPCFLMTGTLLVVRMSRSTGRGRWVGPDRPPARSKPKGVSRPVGWPPGGPARLPGRVMPPWRLSGAGTTPGPTGQGGNRGGMLQGCPTAACRRHRSRRGPAPRGGVRGGWHGTCSAARARRRRITGQVFMYAIATGRPSEIRSPTSATPSRPRSGRITHSSRKASCPSI
jgi:hypothetical protein